MLIGKQTPDGNFKQMDLTTGEVKVITNSRRSRVRELVLILLQGSPYLSHTNVDIVVEMAVRLDDQIEAVK